MATDAAAEIKARLDIIDVIGSQVPLRKAGREHVGLCPFHGEKTPSFTVSRQKQVWFCHGCGQGGDVFSFVMRIDHADFPQALETLAERAGVELERPGPGGPPAGQGRTRKRVIELQARAQSFFEHVLWGTTAGAPGRDLLARRGVAEETARRFGVGFAPAGGAGEDALVRYLTRRAGATVAEVVDAGLGHPPRGGHVRDRFRHRLIFPIRDERGRAIAFGGRALGEGAKYLNSPETAAYHKSSALFGLDLARTAIAESRTALIVEGYFDVMTCHDAGVPVAVASSGTALTREQVRMLHRYADSVVLCFDSDPAGQNATSKAVDLIAAEGCACRICRLPPGVKDPDELGRRDPAALLEAVSSARPEWQVLLDAALGDSEGGTVDARVAAAERCVSVLIRIPVAAVRELYLQEAARRLDLSPESLSTDVSRALREPRRREAPLVVPAPSPAHETGDEESSEPLPPPPPGESLIAALSIQRPPLARALVEDLGLKLDEITHSQVRRLVEVALMTEPPAAYPVHRLASADQRLAAELLIRPLPMLDDDAPQRDLERAMADSVLLIREAAVHRAIDSVRRELYGARTEGRDQEVQTLADRLTQLAGEAEQLRHPGGR
ncbi:MAG: DNA primase [Candidatus Dormibacteria bacterium]